MTSKEQFPIQEVKDILAGLQDEKAKKSILKKLYTPGNKEIAELLIPYERSVVEKELIFALQTNDQERIMEMAKKEIEYYFKNGFHISLAGKLETWNNPKINEYVLSQVQNGATEQDLRNNLYVLEKIGTQEQIKKNREVLLEMQLKNTEYPDNGADVLVELGRYEESIDRRIKYFSEDQYYMAKYARIIAQKHAPHRQDEIAKLVVKHGIKRGREDVFYECSIYLGGKNKVTSVIKKSIDEILYTKGFLSKTENEISSLPRYFNEIAKVMKKLGGFEKEIGILSAKLEDVVNKENGLLADNYKEMARFYNIIEEKEKCLERFHKALVYEISKCHPSHAEGTLKAIEELYGEGFFEDKKMQMLEKSGKFDEAAKIAEKLGLKEKAEAYKKTAEILSGTEIE